MDVAICLGRFIMDSVDVKSHVREDNEFVIFFGRQEFFLSSFFNLWSLRQFQMSKLKEKKSFASLLVSLSGEKREQVLMFLVTASNMVCFLSRRFSGLSFNYATSLLDLICTAFSNVTL